jgi:hypothetical protein
VCFALDPKAAARAAFATSGLILVQSLLTDYRVGAKPVFSFETHGKMDAVFASSSWMLPLLFGFKDTAAGKIFEGNSLAEASVVAITDWNSQRARCLGRIAVGTSMFIVQQISGILIVLLILLDVFLTVPYARMGSGLISLQLARTAGGCW